MIGAKGSIRIDPGQGGEKFSPLMLKPSRGIRSRGTPPTIVEALKAQEIKQGDALRLQCVVSGDPDVEFNWTRNNIPLRESKNVSFGRDEDGRLFLSIQACKAEDSGIYMVTAKNSFGMAKISCQVLVVSVDKRDVRDLSSKAAVFLSFPQDQIIKVNETVRLVFELRIYIDTRILWLFNGRPLKATPRFKTSFDGSRALLIIENFQVEDSGLYSIIALSGDQMSTKDIQLVTESSNFKRDEITQRRSIDKRSYDQLNTPFIERSLKPVQSKIVRLENRIPSFVKTISNIAVAMGRDAHLIAQIRGYPFPTIRWIFHGVSITTSDRLQCDVNEDNGLVRLLILNVNEKDFGQYTLTIENELGRVSCSARIYLSSEEDIVPESQGASVPTLSSANIPADPSFFQSGTDSSSFVAWKSFERLESLKPASEDREPQVELDSDKPILLAGLRDMSVMEGDTFTLSATVSSDTIPKLIWLKDDGPIKSSSRIQTHFDKVKGKASLVILGATVQDIGLYGLVVKNQKGYITTHSNVQVNRTPNIDNSPFVAADKFIDLEAQPEPKDYTDQSGVSDLSCIPNINKLLDIEKSGGNAISNIEEIPRPSDQLSLIQHLTTDITVNEGYPFSLQARFSAFPLPKWVWYHNDVEIDAGSRYRPSYDPFMQTALLYVEAASRSDDGRFKLKVSNNAGELETSSNVTVVPVPGIDRSAIYSEESFASLEKQPPTIEYVSGIDNQSYAGDLTAIGLIDADKIPAQAELQEAPAVIPTILTTMNDVEVIRGERITLTVKIGGTPIPTLKWTRNSQAVEASNRITINYDLALKEAQLYIYDAKPFDTGLYEVTASNPAGSASASMSVKVQSDKSIDDTFLLESNTCAMLDQPKFQPYDVQAGVDSSHFVSPDKFEQLELKPASEARFVEFPIEHSLPTFASPLVQEVTSMEGNTVQLIAVVSAVPVPEFKWTRNGELLPMSNRIQQDYNLASKLCCLTISGVTSWDSGTYKLEASNVEGHIESSCQLTVQATGNIDSKAMIPPHVFESVEATKLKQYEVVPGVDNSSMFNQQLYQALDKDKPPHMITVHELEKAIPRLLSPLADVSVEEGTDACLMCQPFGLPLPEITWFKDSKPIDASNRIVIHYDILNKKAYLWIKKCKAVDTGHYKIQARNEVGVTTSECTLHVQADERLIEDSSFVSKEKFVNLERERDDSEYSRLQPGIDDTSSINPAVLERLEAPPVVERVDEGPSEQYEILQIVQSLEDQHVQEYMPLILSVTLSGRPVQEVEWLLNGQPIIAGSDVAKEYDAFTNSAFLRIRSINADMHTGLYTVIVTNKMGAAKSQCRVTVDKMPSVDEGTDRDLNSYSNLDVKIIARDYGDGGVDYKPYTHSLSKLLELDVMSKLSEPVEMPEELIKPNFTHPPSVSKENVFEMDSITLAVPVIGKPIPLFYWMKDGSSLLYSNRFAMNYDILSRTLFLYIQQVKVDDCGVYYAVAENSAGSAMSGSIQLKITPLDAIDKQGYRPAHLFVSLDEEKPIHRGLPEESGVDRTTNVAEGLDRLLDLDRKIPTPLDVVAGVDRNGFRDSSLFTDLDIPRYYHKVEYKDIHELRAPVFISKMSGTDTMEGQSALISVMVDGWPSPMIQWYRADMILPSSNRISHTYDPYSKIASLLIKNAKLSDSGTYSIKCSNDLGSVMNHSQINISKDILIDSRTQVSQAGESIIAGLEAPRFVPPIYTAGVDRSNFVSVDRIEELESSLIRVPASYTSGIDQSSFVDETKFTGLERPIEKAEFVDDESTYRVPSIIQPISDVEVRERDSICLSAIIDSLPVASFEMYKDGNPIKSSNRICSFYDINSKLLYIRINSCVPNDQGTYMVIASNKCGSSNTSCHVTVLPTESIDFTSMNPAVLDRIKTLDQAHQYGREEYEIDDMEQYEAPMFHEDSQTVEIFEGTHLSVPIQLKQAYPIPLFQWYKNDKPMQTASRFLHHYDMHSRILLFKILHTSIGDAGQYMVKATNKAGTAQFSLTINVKAIPSIDRSWQSDRYSQPIRALNELLEKPLPVTIVAPIVDYSSFVSDIGKFRELDTDKEPHKVVVRDLKTSCEPKILHHIQDQTASETDDVMLQAQINCPQPMCTLHWFKNKRVINASNRIRSSYDVVSGIIRLQILKAQMSDAGEYTVKIKNDLGEVESTCRIIVNRIAAIDDSAKLSSEVLLNLERPIPVGPTLEKHELALKPLVSAEALDKLSEVEMQMIQRSQPVRDQIEEDYISLQIVKQPAGKIDCIEGDTVHIECTVVGKPLPQFMWYRNDRPLPDANRFSSHYNLLTNTAVLHIRYTLASLDCGTYLLQCRDVRGKIIRSSGCVLNVTPVDPIQRQQLIESDEGIRNIERLAQQVADRKSLSYSKLVPGVDKRGFVDIDKFTQLEKQELALTQITAGVDSSGNVPLERFIDLEKALPLKSFMAGIDKSSNVGPTTLQHLSSFDRYRFVEMYEPLTREPRMKLVHAFQNDVVSCVEGNPISLICTIDAFPLPEVVWYHDGLAISSAQRTISNYDPFSGVTTLHFMTTYKSDSGLYKLKCTNSAGTVEQHIKLIVEETSDVDETSYIRSSSNYRLLSGNLEFTGKENVENRDFLAFPSLTVLAVIHEDVTIRYCPIGGASAEVRWMLNGVEITEILKINISEDGTCWFTLRDLSLDQCGQYMCIIKNSFGEFKRSFDLRVDSPSVASGIGSSPILVQELKSKIAYEGAKVEMEVVFQSANDCSVDWLLNDLPIKFNERVSYQTDQTGSKLVIKATRKSDAGWYQCVVANPAGTCNTKAKLIVIAGEGQETTQLSPLNLRTVDFNRPESDVRAKWMKQPVQKEEIDPAKFFYGQLRRRRDVRGSIESSEKLTDEDIYQKERSQPARLKIRLPGNVEFVEGHDVLLQTTAVPINDPAMKVNWFKDGNIIETGSRLVVTFEMGYACLNIIKADSSDAGSYECRVSNSHGQDKSTCLLVCQYTRPVQVESSLTAEGLRRLQNLDELSGSGPAFTVAEDQQRKGTDKPTLAMALKDVEVKEGQPVKFVAKFTSRDKLRARWTLNDKPILNIDRFSITGDGGINILSIDRVRYIDNGVVCCTVKGKSGSETTSCKLSVIPAEKIPYIDLVMDSAMDMNLDAAEIASMQEEFKAKILSNPAFNQAKSDAVALIKQLVQDLRQKYQAIAASKPKLEKPAEQPAPEFVLQLNSSVPLVVNETECLSLSVKYRPSNCVVKWSHNNAILLDSQDVNIRTDANGRSCLVIPYALLSDSGSYAVRISNALGSTGCSADVKVQPIAKGDKRSNRLLVVPEKQLVGVGSTALFTSRCRQAVTWGRADGKKLPVGRSFTKSADRVIHTLAIRKVIHSDAGQYTCKIAGDDTCVVPFALEVTDQQKQEVNVTVPLAAEREVEEGSLVKLECQIQLTSQNEKCIWKKDGVPLSGNMAVAESVGELHTLCIYDACVGDAGKYQAVMETSKLTSQCTLKVKGRSQTDLELMKPLFAGAMKSTSILQGQSCKFEFFLNEKTTEPSVQWMKNNQELTQSTDYDIWYKDGHGVLFINKCSAEDAGLYSAHVSLNNLTGTCSATLNVKQF